MMTPLRLLVVLMLCAAPLGARTRAEPPVKVHVDVHVPAPVAGVLVQVAPAPPRPRPAPPAYPVHDGPPAHHEERPPGEWGRHEPPGHPYHVPPDRVPGQGLCRIWYDDLPPDRQPPPMRCGRAHHVARRHGGRVIWVGSRHAQGDGRVESVSYGRVDFTGVPPDRLPPPGSCRVWLEGVPPDRQPPPGPCEHAEREARRTGGRLLYMPGA